MKSYQILFILLWAELHFHEGVAMTMKQKKMEDSPQDVEDDADEPIPSPFSEDEIDELLDWHNYARGTVTPTASNMEYLVRHNTLPHL